MSGTRSQCQMTLILNVALNRGQVKYLCVRTLTQQHSAHQTWHIGTLLRAKGRRWRSTDRAMPIIDFGVKRPLAEVECLPSPHWRDRRAPAFTAERAIKRPVWTSLVVSCNCTRKLLSRVPSRGCR